MKEGKILVLYSGSYILKLINKNEVPGVDDLIPFAFPEENWEHPDWVTLPKLRRNICVFFYDNDENGSLPILSILAISSTKKNAFRLARDYVITVFGDDSENVRRIHLEYDIDRDAWCPTSGVRYLYETPYANSK